MSTIQEESNNLLAKKLNDNDKNLITSELYPIIKQFDEQIITVGRLKMICAKLYDNVNAKQVDMLADEIWQKFVVDKKLVEISLALHAVLAQVNIQRDEMILQSTNKKMSEYVPSPDNSIRDMFG